MPRSLYIGENKVQEYLDIIKLKGISNRHLYEVNRYIRRYLTNVNNIINKSNTIVYFSRIKDSYSVSSYRKESYQILKFLRYLKVPWTDEIKLPPEPNYYPKNISKDDIVCTLKYFKNCEHFPRFKALILLGADSGMRAEELYQLKVEDINLEDRIVHINHNPKNGQSTKTKKSRISFFTEYTKEVLIEYLGYFNHSRLKELFPQKWIERKFKDAPIQVKDLRKFFSQEWDRRGGSTSIKKILMGHSLKGDVDLMHYNYQSEEDLKKIYDRVMDSNVILDIGHSEQIDSKTSHCQCRYCI